MAVNYMEGFDMRSLKHYCPPGALFPAPDEYVGELVVQNQKMVLEISPRDQIDYANQSISFRSQKRYHENNLLVVLESPHRFEYDASGQPIALMMGKTGQLFFDNFVFNLSNSTMKINDGTYNVIVCNAIQYQTSCGLNPIDRNLRDQNWLEIYNEHGGKLDFKNRVFSIKPKYTINLCTGGMNPNGLRSQICQSLDEFGLKKGKHYTEGDHSSSWYVKREASHLFIV
ncbi:MAG: hypothetical protein AB7V00_06815 [Bacilli bacterium]